MTDKNINLYDTEEEQLRYNVSMLPTHLLMKGLPEGKSLMRKLIKGLSKIPKKQKVQIANIFDNLATTQEKGSVKPEDISLEDGELSEHPYESLVRMLGAETSTHLLEHVEVVDSCLKQKFNNQLIINFKTYLSDTFNYEDDALNVDMPVDEFYLYLVLSFIAHLDACIHHAAYSKVIKPISLGWLFMQKLNPDKWHYDSTSKKYNLINKNGSPFTCTSRSFIHLLLTVLYFQEHGIMPTSLYGIRGKIDWRVEDEEGKLDEFIYKKSERDSKRNWLSLADVLWLVGMKDSAKDEPNEVLINWQQSFVKHIKTEDIDDLKGLPPSAEAIIWFIYAFFQNTFEQTDKQNKKHNKQSCIIHHDYYDLWESMTTYYESKVSEDLKVERVDWPDYLKKQATRTERMT
ncbi:hypothetical protein [uncultured Psychrobacter sp.]|uniref:hypothetical protein n=1 Tax=uncultured Psychrobacter sp. TaxID=259303 RepID=UPI003458A93C